MPQRGRAQTPCRGPGALRARRLSAFARPRTRETPEGRYAQNAWRKIIRRPFVRAVSARAAA